MYEDYEDDGAMDIIEERERELKERKRQKALAAKQKQAETGQSQQRGRPKKRKDSDEDEDFDSGSGDDDEPPMSFGADSRRARSKKPAPKPTKSSQSQQEFASQEAEEAVEVNDDAAQKAKIEEAMKKAVAAQKPRRQLPKMDVERLLGENGLNKLCEMAERFKTSDKQSTSQKLTQLMALYELWSHVMFPSMAFSDVVKRLETLGPKRPVQSFMRKLRLGENPGPWNIQVQNSDDENDARTAGPANPLFEADDPMDDDNDNFDDFLSQALDQVEAVGGSTKTSSKAASVTKNAPVVMDDDEDLNELDAFLDNLNKPIRDELL